MLPTMNKYGERAVYESPGYVDIPQKIDAVSDTDERNVIDQLVQELNRSFMTELAECTVDRDVDNCQDEEEDPLHGKRIIMLGASHAVRMANILEDMGAIVVDLSIPGWKITSENVNSQVEQLASVLAESFDGETYIVYHLFDNSVFLESNDDIHLLPEKGPDGKYHIRGKLTIADRDIIKKLFTEVLPLLRSGLDHKKFILSPLLRYTVKSCCRDVSHLTNKKDKDFLQSQVIGLTDICSWLNAMAFTRRIRNFVVINPVQLLGPEDDIVASAVAVSQYYKDDPVHLSVAGYTDLCTQLVEKMTNSNFKRVKADAARADQQAGSQIDWAARRSRWVLENDSSVHRADTSNFRGGPFRSCGRWPARGRGGRGRTDRGGRGGSAGGNKGWWGKNHRKNPY
jgi:hypothetical protein